ncbi:MAG TPA: cyclic nucleotide-binding domain-containing protein, partial [Candidatus Methylacidiphilales bacterium]|nr:cyclic nucleotide-binding domain-containing protein [Candidatus Methylacidiphilales bacterium]
RARVGPGETLGEISPFDPGPATATVTASEFSQLWRIADEDLIQFMEDNPGAGNVLLRTLAAILAQRLRRMDPEAFGLSAYAVVQSPDLKKLPSIDEAEEEDELPDDVAALQPSVTAAPATASPSPVETAKPVRPNEPVVPADKPNKKTQPFVDPDEEELEPL